MSYDEEWEAEKVAGSPPMNIYHGEYNRDSPDLAIRIANIVGDAKDGTSKPLGVTSNIRFGGMTSFLTVLKWKVRGHMHRGKP